MESQHLPSLVAFVGLLGTLTLSDVNVLMAIVVGFTTFIYLIIKIIKELKDGSD